MIRDSQRFRSCVLLSFYYLFVVFGGYGDHSFIENLQIVRLLGFRILSYYFLILNITVFTIVPLSLNAPLSTSNHSIGSARSSSYTFPSRVCMLELATDTRVPPSFKSEHACSMCFTSWEFEKGGFIIIRSNPLILYSKKSHIWTAVNGYFSVRNLALLGSSSIANRSSTYSSKSFML